MVFRRGVIFTIFVAVVYMVDSALLYGSEDSLKEVMEGYESPQKLFMPQDALFELLLKNGVESHYIKRLNDIDMLCKKVSIIPIEVVVRNIATGSLTKRLGISEGSVLPFALVEFYYKDDALGDPIINDEHCKILGLVKEQSELEMLKAEARKVNEILRDFFDKRGLKLVDFKLEFGRDKDSKIILADEISPDSCRFWDKQTNQKLDKDRFRQNLGSVKVAYEEVLKRILES